MRRRSTLGEGGGLQSDILEGLATRNISWECLTTGTLALAWEAATSPHQHTTYPMSLLDSFAFGRIAPGGRFSFRCTYSSHPHTPFVWDHGKWSHEFWPAPPLQHICGEAPRRGSIWAEPASEGLGSPFHIPSLPWTILYFWRVRCILRRHASIGFIKSRGFGTSIPSPLRRTLPFNDGILDGDAVLAACRLSVGAWIPYDADEMANDG